MGSVSFVVRQKRASCQQGCAEGSKKVFIGFLNGHTPFGVVLPFGFDDSGEPTVAARQETEGGGSENVRVF